MSSDPIKHAPPRIFHLALFATGLMWFFISHLAAGHAAQSIASVFASPMLASLLQELFELALLVAGFAALESVASRKGNLQQTNSLPLRASAGREFRLGFALGWAMIVAVALLMMLCGQMHPLFWFAGRAWGMALMQILTLALATLVSEVAYRGFLFRKLIDAFGDVPASLLISCFYALLTVSSPGSSILSVTVAFTFGVLYATAYLRTHALWISWGIHFGWVVMLTVVFGLPLRSSNLFSSVVSTDFSGPSWWNGGSFGPDGSTLALAAALGGLAILYRMTRDYAWQYTHAPIVAGGYPMEAQPPAAHVAMERSAAFSAPAAPSPASLVQIQASTPQDSSTVAAIDEHLKRKDEGAPLE